MAREIGADGTWVMPASDGPCFTWPVAGCTSFPDDLGTWDEEMYQAVEIASDGLWRATSGRYGLCEQLVRPCRRPAAVTTRRGLTRSPGPFPLLVGGQWINLSCHCPPTSSGGCTCPGSKVIRLPGPVWFDDYHPITITVDGEELPDTAFQLYDQDVLTRVDGGGWPYEQDLALPLTESGTWAITYYRGTPVPVGGRRACGEYAEQLWMACTRNPNCRLPPRVQNMVREGLDMTMFDPRDYLEDGLTGLELPDRWITSVNPHRHKSPPGVYSVDGDQFAVMTSFPTTWPGPPPGGSPQALRFVQNQAQLIWTIVHNLGMYPGGVTVEDSGGQEVNGEVSYPDINTVRIEFSAPVSGVAYLS